MIKLFTIRWGAFLLPLLMSFQLFSNVVASEQLNTKQNKVQLNAIGKILLDKKTNEYYFLFTENDRETVYSISIKDRKTFEQLKNLNNKWVRVSGYKKWINELFIELPRYLLKLEIEQLQELRLADFKVFQNNDQSKFAEIDYRVIDGDRVKFHNQKGIAISDEAANRLIAGAAVVIGIAVGPMSLVPASLLGLKSIFLDD